MDIGILFHSLEAFFVLFMKCDNFEAGILQSGEGLRVNKCISRLPNKNCVIPTQLIVEKCYEYESRATLRATLVHRILQGVSVSCGRNR